MGDFRPSIPHTPGNTPKVRWRIHGGFNSVSTIDPKRIQIALKFHVLFDHSRHRGIFQNFDALNKNAQLKFMFLLVFRLL